MLVTSHSDKEKAAGTYKGGYGYHPLLCFLHPMAEALAGKLRPGNAGSNTAADHIEVLEMALEQLPPDITTTNTLIARSGSAGASHDFVNELRHRSIQFSVGLDLTEKVRKAILAMPERAWVPAVTADNEERDAEEASVCELKELDLSSWPAGTRAICRREIHHPGAQMTFSDANGYRFQVIITDRPDRDIAYLEANHRNHARVEDRIRCAKATGMRAFPFHSFAMNEAWLEMVLVAADLCHGCRGCA